MELIFSSGTGRIVESGHL